jgi:microcystin-dependent protein
MPTIYGPSSTVTATPAGVIEMFGGSSAPTGYLMCDGSAVSRTTFANLFAALGTAYGPGDGSTTFNLPQFNNGTMPRGQPPGSSGGASTHTHGSSSLAAQLRINTTDQLMDMNIITVPSWNANFRGTAGTVTTPTVARTNAVNVSGNTDGPSNGLPPWLGVNFIIKT